MDILKRSISNITEEAWKEIDEQAAKVLRGNLSARKFVDVKGPMGWNYAALPLGRLSVPSAQEGKGVTYGIHQVMPLVEGRAFFELDVWELDNLARGAQDPDLSALEQAAAQMARFEENAIYNGFDEACIRGLSSVSEGNTVKGSRNRLVDMITEGILKLGTDSVEGPYTLIADKKLWQTIVSKSEGYPLKKRIESVIDGGIVLSPVVDQSYLVSTRGGDMEMVLGQDFSIGYHSATTEKVRLFITESFTFRVIAPEAIIRLSIED